MARFDITQPQQRDGDNEWTPLATGQYVMQIAEAKIAPSPFAEKQTDFATGKEVEVFPDRLSITWKLAEWNEEYDDAGYQEGQKVFQQFNPWYGDTKKGPSKFKQFIDPLIQEGLIPAQFTIADGETPGTEGDLVGITRRVMVENYAKTMGPNKGQPGNRVLAVTAPKATRTTVRELVKNGGKVNLDDVDAADAAPVSDLQGMTKEDLIDYATTLASQVGSFWAKKNDWQLQGVSTLQANIRRMEAKLNETPVVMAAADELF